MAAIAEAVRDGRIPDSEVAVVISDKRKAPGLDKARLLGIDAIVVGRQGRSREAHDEEIASELEERGVDLICLGGYMRLLSPRFVRHFKNRILNIHPSLLPSFKGLDAHAQAIEYGVKISGCTVHFVDEELDHGAIILQKAVEVRDSDTPEDLSARILDFEHDAYVEAVRTVVEGRFRLEGRKFISLDD